VTFFLAVRVSSEFLHLEKMSGRRRRRRLIYRQLDLVGNENVDKNFGVGVRETR